MQKCSDIRRQITDVLSTPAVLKGVLEKWPSKKWSPEYLASLLTEKSVKIRVGPVSAKNMRSVLWEGNCAHEDATLCQFCEWLSGNHKAKSNPTCSVPLENNPLMKYNRHDYWCYVDYKQMAFLFENHPEVFQEVQWSDLGFKDRDGRQSTIWIGSEGAFTPGHYDTYGFNLVAEIYGRKRWHLFPPSQTDLLYPTRLPYEESSVFSPINISNPDPEIYPKFAEATPYIVTLEPGEVLFVPKHWWHFVESLDTSISINTWVVVESDKESRVQEAVTRVLVSSLMANSSTPTNWLCPSETAVCDEETNYRYIKASLEDYFDKSLQHLHVPRTTELHEFQEELLGKDLTHQQNPDASQTEEDDGMAASDEIRKAGKLSSSIIKTDKSLPSVDLDNPKNFQCAERETERRKNKEPTQIDIPTKLSKTDQHQHFPTQSTDVLSNLVVPVKCCGKIYKNNRLGIDSRFSGSTKEGEVMHMQMDSKSRTDLHIDDLREMLVQCVTHPDVVSLIATKLKDNI